MKSQHPPRFTHQQKLFTTTKDKVAYAYLMEMGTGKTRPAIETAVHLFKTGKIEALVVLAPNGVQRNWVLNEIPKWCTINHRAVWWSSNPNKPQQKAIEQLTARPFSGLRILTANYESCVLPEFKSYIKKFLRSFPNMLVLDESTRIKTPSAKRTKFIVSLRQHSTYRRIMSGFVTPNSPFDLYKQFEFLDPSILGFSSFFAFKAHFAEIEDNKFLLQAIKKCNQAKAEATGKQYWSGRAPQLVKKHPTTGQPLYRKLDELYKLIAPHSFRVMKSDCLVDLPPKIFSRLPIELTGKQRNAYDAVLGGLIAEFNEGEITTQLAIVKMIRLQQIAGGFWQLDDTRSIKPIDGKFPKLEALMDDIEDVQGKTIIWTHFKHENVLITKAIAEAYGSQSVVQYYGAVNNNAKQFAVDKFQNIVRNERNEVVGEEDSGVRFFVGEPHSGGIGIELTKAETVYYHSNSFNLEDRLQSEDRAHRSGLKHSVTYKDVEAIDTIEGAIISALRAKKDIAHIIMGDGIVNWLTNN